MRFRIKTFFYKRVIFAQKALPVIFIALLVALLVAECIVRISDVDWRNVKKNLYFQNMDLPVHIIDPNPKLIFRLKPNSEFHDKHSVSINSLGVRGKQRDAVKPDGVFRILCFGGSNVYGSGVNDQEAWPAQLELFLQNQSERPFEVWNMGAPAYVPSQMVALARESVKRFDPDLLIIAISNLNAPAFLKGMDIEAYFNRNPSLWEKLIPRSALIPSWLSVRTRYWLISHVRFYRLAILASLARRVTIPLWEDSYDHNIDNERAVRDLFLDIHPNIPCVLFIGPYIQPSVLVPGSGGKIISGYEHYITMAQNSGVPIFTLSATYEPAVYREIHPPPNVLAWYGKNLADWLIRQKHAPVF